MCLWNSCIDAPSIFCIYTWRLKSLNATLWFLKTFQHLSKSCGFPNVPHILGIGKLVVCNNRKKKKKKKEVLSVLLTLMHSFGFEHGGWISKSFVAKAINRYKTSTESDQSTSLAGQSVCRFTTYSLCNLQCQRSCTMAIKDLLVVLSTVQCVYASKGSL